MSLSESPLGVVSDIVVGFAMHCVGELCICMSCLQGNVIDFYCAFITWVMHGAFLLYLRVDVSTANCHNHNFMYPLQDDKHVHAQQDLRAVSLEATSFTSTRPCLHSSFKTSAAFRVC